MVRKLAEDIIGMSEDGVSDFIREQRRAKTLSRVVRALNGEVLDGDAGARSRAEEALSRLGLLEVA
ncbi:hypothetical protein HKCCE2091_14010 [Rhodobacterales bacterium HKCCE2091]|nr:hypothetical protein [Rhodobacterales bacterium HKCCE2091]